MPDWLTQCGQCRTNANLGILACRLTLFPDCSIGWYHPYYRLQSTDCFIDSIHWPGSLHTEMTRWLFLAELCTECPSSHCCWAWSSIALSAFAAAAAAAAAGGYANTWPCAIVSWHSKYEKGSFFKLGVHHRIIQSGCRHIPPTPYQNFGFIHVCVYMNIGLFVI